MSSKLFGTLAESKVLLPREKLLVRGAANLSDRELVSILLRTGVAKENVLELSKRLLDTYRLSDLADFSVSELLQISGIQPLKAVTLSAAFEVGKRVFEQKSSTQISIQSPEQALPFLFGLRSLRKEHFVALYLDIKNRLIHQETISVGILNASLVHPREVFEPAVRVSAAGIILCHNHPSGDTSPSQEDIQLTAQLVQAGEILGIEILDHLIVGKNSYDSLKQSGLLGS